MLRILTLILITCLGLTLAQYSGSNLHYRPRRLMWTKDEWFQQLLDDNTQHHNPALFIDNTIQTFCDRSCWEAEYTYSYYRYRTGECLCSFQDVTADIVMDQRQYPDAYPVENYAKLTLLNANFQAFYPCLQQIALFNETYTTPVEECINSCGVPATQRRSIFSVVRPTLTVTEDPPGIYECYCTDRQPAATENDCGLWMNHVFVKYYQVD
ncbi:uncharacterized protein L201_001070 [Kwoniella dendrophila CBS 6074]|uniref:Apple domain-containing protein n=1 Tax=Kwoniella dendrophila CBS 6074 TaxID=1295534 RepID=A0AAX4JL96_9TREE